MKKKIVALIPAYNEELHIAQVIERVRPHVSQIVVVDDGSSDRTAELARAAGADVVLNHPVNGGKGVALQTGFSYALSTDASHVITIDADDQHDPLEIPAFLREMEESGSSIVIGARERNRKMPGIFRFGNYFLNNSFSVLFGTKVSDTQSGYRLFAAQHLAELQLESAGYEIETEILAKAGKKKMSISEIPISTKYHNKYKGTTVLDGVRIFMKMLSWRIGK